MHFKTNNVVTLYCNYYHSWFDNNWILLLLLLSYRVLVFRVIWVTSSLIEFFSLVLNATQTVVSIQIHTINHISHFFWHLTHVKSYAFWWNNKFPPPSDISVINKQLLQFTTWKKTFFFHFSSKNYILSLMLNNKC